jgi:hypothetical protein
MAKIERKTFDTPEETRTVAKTRVDVVQLGDVTAMRALRTGLAMVGMCQARGGNR